MLTLIHNNSCSKSNCLYDYLIENGVPHQLRDYIHQPLSQQALSQLLELLQASDPGFDPRSLVRTSDAEFLAYTALDLEDKATLISILHACPSLLQRPILMTENSAVIGRPFEKALAFLEAQDL